MFGHDKNIKDTTKNLLKDNLSLNVLYEEDQAMTNSYQKLNKLITALYIVTDIIEKTEPIRLNLRTLGANILSDISSQSRSDIKDKVQAILSLLDISLTIHLISEMNCNILKKEFMIFYQTLGETKQKTSIVSHAWLEEFLKEPQVSLAEQMSTETRLRIPDNNKNKGINLPINNSSENQFFGLKKQRRADIIQAIKDNNGNATITEVKQKGSPALATCGEKTLQRELVSMVKDNILDKKGEKRWSKYSLKIEGDLVRNELPL